MSVSAEPSAKAVSPGTEDVGLAGLAHSGSILERTAHGALWVVGWRLATRLLGFIDTLILARLLVPADFGVVTLGWSFAFGLDTLSTVGVEQAIIRDDHPDRDLYDTGFTINLIRALLMGAILAVAAPTIATLLANRRLDAIVLTFAAVTALTGFTNIGVVDFRRYIAFDKEFVYKLVPRTLAVGVAITVAVIWRSYWALVAGIVSGTLCTVAFSYLVHPYRPHVTLRAWRRLFSFSLWMWVRGLISTIRTQAPVLIVGRLNGAAAVGILSVGDEIANLPTSELIAPLSRACFSGFSAARRNEDNPADAFLRLLAAMALLTLPAGFGISLVAFPLVKLAFGPAWMQAVPLVEVLGVAGTLTLFGSISGSLFSAHAWLRQAAAISGATTIVCLALLVALVPRFGVLGAAVAIAVADGFNQMIYLIATLRRLRLRFSELFSRIWRSILATAMMTLALTWLGLGWSTIGEATQVGLAVHLFGAAIIGAAIYCTVLFIAWIVSGRPSGAETDLLQLATRLLGNVARRRKRA